MHGPSAGSFPLPKRNYGFEKHQKELTKQRKKEDKRQRKLERASERQEDLKREEAGALEQPPEN
jgi:hypothetical protein